MIHFLILLFGVTMLYTAATGRIESYVRVLVVQGACLFALVLMEFDPAHLWGFVFLAVETLGFKTLVIPGFLLRVVRRNAINRDLGAALSHFHSLVLAGIVFALGFLLAGEASARGVLPLRSLYFGVAVSTILLALLIIVTRRMLVTHAIGYMMLENGIFLLSLAVAREMPILVHLGVLLDIFMGIFLLGLFVTKIKSTWDESRVDALVHLRD